MTLFDGSWLDGRVRILEPAAADAVATVPVSLPGASPGAPAAASLCYLQHAELLLASFEGTRLRNSGAILAQFRRNSGAILAQFCAIPLTPPSLLASFEGASIVIAADATDGTLKAELGGTRGRVSDRAPHHTRAR